MMQKSQPQAKLEQTPRDEACMLSYYLTTFVSFSLLIIFIVLSAFNHDANVSTTLTKAFLVSTLVLNYPPTYVTCHGTNRRHGLALRQE